MAKKKHGVSRPRARPPPPTPNTPTPPANLADLVKVVVWPKGKIIHRIHVRAYGSTQFNPGPKGNARFSPIKDSADESIPTIYGGSDFDCAAMETIFHDVPFVPGMKTLAKDKLVDQVYSQIAPKRDLQLIDLSSTALRKLGIQRSQLIDTEKDQYPKTRNWAGAIHTASPKADGLRWVSRQHDQTYALVLFGDRIHLDDLVIADGPRSVLNVIPIYEALLEIAVTIGVTILDAI
jgi:hypothetical protein